MKILEHGQTQEKTLLFLPCTAEPVWAFAATIALLSQKWHVFQMVYDGHQPEYPGDFTSVEQMVDEITAYLKERGVSRLDAAYGCSLGGACLTRMLALVIIEGRTMYLSEADVKRIFDVIAGRFPKATVFVETMNPMVVKRFKEKSIEGSHAKFTWGVKNGKALAALLPELEEELPLFPQEAIRDTDSIAQIREANSLFFIGIILSGGGRCVPSEKSSKLRRRVDPTQCCN